MQLECNASEAGSLLYCSICTKKHFLSSAFMVSCKMFLVQTQRSSHRNRPHDFGKSGSTFAVCGGDVQHDGGCCLEVV